MLEFRFGRGRRRPNRSRLGLHQPKVAVLLALSACWGGGVRVDGSLRGRLCTSILDDEVTAEFVATHRVHRSQVALVLTYASILTRHTRVVLVHYVCKVHPLISVSVSILRRVRLRPRHLTDPHSLRVVRAHKHRRLSVARRARLGAEAARVQVATGGLGVADAGLHYVDGSTRLRLAALLNVRQQALDFLVARCRRHIGEVG